MITKSILTWKIVFQKKYFFTNQRPQIDDDKYLVSQLVLTFYKATQLLSSILLPENTCRGEGAPSQLEIFPCTSWIMFCQSLNFSLDAAQVLLEMFHCTYVTFIFAKFKKKFNSFFCRLHFSLAEHYWLSTGNGQSLTMSHINEPNENDFYFISFFSNFKSCKSFRGPVVSNDLTFSLFSFQMRSKRTL